LSFQWESILKLRVSGAAAVVRCFTVAEHRRPTAQGRPIANPTAAVASKADVVMALGDADLDATA
jgi:hypothetical protein